jgi:hypothetical protein
MIKNNIQEIQTIFFPSRQRTSGGEIKNSKWIMSSPTVQCSGWKRSKKRMTNTLIELFRSKWSQIVDWENDWNISSGQIRKDHPGRSRWFNNTRYVLSPSTKEAGEKLVKNLLASITQLRFEHTYPKGLEVF